jgi:hypothetical protein
MTCRCAVRRPPGSTVRGAVPAARERTDAPRAEPADQPGSTSAVSASAGRDGASIKLRHRLRRNTAPPSG